MRVLELYTHEGCFSRGRSLEMLRKILPRCSDISFHVVDIMKYPDKAKALGIRMSPTLVMDGKIIAVGMPEEKQLRAMLRTKQKKKMSNLKQNTVLFIVFAGIFSVCNPLPADSGGGFVFDHSRYAKVLQMNVRNGKVDYQNLKQHRKDLDDYVKSLESLSKENYHRMNRNEKIAFWINAYNAITLRVIIDHYPIQRHGLIGLLFPSNSIRQIPGAWDRITHRVLEKETTLNEIEHQILRKQFHDPRIHFALVCAAIGCPELRNEPYEGARLDSQLSEQIHSFLSDPPKARYDAQTATLYLSPIFRWFKSDFNAGGGIPAFIRNHSQIKTFKDLPAGTKIEWLNYDWSLNERRG